MTNTYKGSRKYQAIVQAGKLNQKFTDWAEGEAHRASRCCDMDADGRTQSKKFSNCEYICYWLLRCGGVL